MTTRKTEPIHWTDRIVWMWLAISPVIAVVLGYVVALMKNGILTEL
jgi:hypothetical protein